jgi:hypothetical protein
MEWQLAERGWREGRRAGKWEVVQALRVEGVATGAWSRERMTSRASKMRVAQETVYKKIGEW